MKINFRKIATNKHIDLTKIENFVRSKGKIADFRKPCKKFNIVDEIPTHKGKRWVIFETIPLYFTVNPVLIYDS